QAASGGRPGPDAPRSVSRSSRDPSSRCCQSARSRRRSCVSAARARRQFPAYLSGHDLYGMSSPGDLPLPDAFLARRPAIILDRDGVLNERPSGAGYVTRPEDFRWLPGSLEALRLLHQAGYRVIIATNQAGIGRGLMTED